MSSAEADLMSSFADACAHFGAYGLVGPLLGGVRGGFHHHRAMPCAIAYRWGYDYELPPASAGGIEKAMI